METTKIKFKTVDEYLAAQPKKVNTILQTIRKTIKQLVPKAEEVISYNIPAFKLNGKTFVFFAGWSEHVSLYPIPQGDSAFQKEIATYKGGKGTIKFPIDEPLPVNLIKKIVKLSAQENEARTLVKTKLTKTKAHSSKSK